MKQIHFGIAFLFVLVGCSKQPEPGAVGPISEDIAATIQARLDGLEAKTNFYAKHLPTGEELAVRADEPVNTLSVIKLAILLRAYRDVDEGHLELDGRYELQPDDYRRGAGVLSAFASGLTPTYRDLLTQMIILSDNTATDIMIKRVGLDRVNQLLEELAYRETRLQGTIADRYRRRWELLDATNVSLTPLEVFERGFPSGPEAEAGRAALNADPAEWLGRTTAREISRLLEQIHKGEVASESSSQEMIGILKKQHSESRLPRRLRFEFENVELAHKTGDSPPDVANDVGILYYPGGPTIVSVFVTENRGDFLEAEKAIGDIAVDLLKHWHKEPKRPH